MWEETDETYKFSVVVFTAFSLCFLWEKVNKSFSERLKESESQMKFSHELVHMKALLEDFTTLSAILFHLLKKVFGIS